MSSEVIIAVVFVTAWGLLTIFGVGIYRGVSKAKGVECEEHVMLALIFWPVFLMVAPLIGAWFITMGIGEATGAWLVYRKIPKATVRDKSRDEV